MSEGEIRGARHRTNLFQKDAGDKVPMINDE